MSNNKLKILTWNCKGAYRKKQKYLLSKFDPDIWIIQECEHPDKFKKQQDFCYPDNVIWFGENKNRGIGVFSRAGYNIKIDKDHNREFRFVVPINVFGITSLKLFAIWAMNSKNVLRKQRYIGQIVSAFKHYKLDRNITTLIAGDFNWNLNFDSNSSGLIGKFNDFLLQMNQNDLQSAYHTSRVEDFGSEVKPTLFLQNNIEKSYHIDYIFGNTSLINKIEKMEVGDYNDWIKYSDHMPVYVEIKI